MGWSSDSRCAAAGTDPPWPPFRKGGKRRRGGFAACGVLRADHWRNGSSKSRGLRCVVLYNSVQTRAAADSRARGDFPPCDPTACRRLP